MDQSMRVIRAGEKLAVDDLKGMASGRFGDMAKAVVDVERGIMAVDGEDFVEFDSMINLRPSRDNRSRGVEDQNLRTRILAIVDSLVQK